MDKVRVLNFTDDDGSTYVIEISTFSDSEGDKKPEKSLEEAQSTEENKFTCYFCDSPFSSLRGLRVHLKTHCKAKDSRTRYAPKRSQFEDSVRDPLEPPTVEKKRLTTERFSCFKCSFICSTKRGIRTHTRRHMKMNEMVCSDCGAVFTRRVDLKTHMKQHYTILLTCKLCEFVTWNSIKLQQHVASNHDVQRFSCDICDFTCTRSNRFVAHMKTHPKDEPAFDYSRIRSKQIRVYSRPVRVKQEPAS